MPETVALRGHDSLERGHKTMTFRGRLLASTTVLGLAAMLPGQAHAGLLGAGRTVQAFHYLITHHPQPTPDAE